MAYGDYYRPRRAARMGDLLDARVAAGASLAGVDVPAAGAARGFPGPDYAAGGAQSTASSTAPGVPPPPLVDYARTQTAEERREARERRRQDRETKRPPTDPQPPAAPPPPATTPSRGSAWKDYGDQDIPGAKESGIWWGANVGQGWNLGRTKDDRGAYTTKNVLGMILSDYAPKPSSIDAFLADPRTKRFFPNAKKVGFDKIDLGDGPIDILTKADPETDTAESWWFNPEMGVEAHAADWTPWTPGASDAAGGETTTQPVGDPDPLATDIAVPRRQYRGPSFRDWMDEAERGYR